MTGDSDTAALVSHWSKSVVPLEALERAVYALADRASATIEDRDNEWAVVLEPRHGEADLAALAHALRQEVNDQSLRVKIAARTEPIRNLVFALAFSRAGLAETADKE